MTTFSNNFTSKNPITNGNGDGDPKKGANASNKAVDSYNIQAKALTDQGYTMGQTYITDDGSGKGSVYGTGTKKGTSTTTSNVSKELKNPYHGTKKTTLSNEQYLKMISKQPSYKGMSGQKLAEAKKIDKSNIDAYNKIIGWKDEVTTTTPDVTKDIKVEFEESTGGGDVVESTPEEINDGSSAAITEDPEKKKKKRKGIKGLLSGISKSKKGKGRGTNVGTSPDMKGSSDSGTIAGNLKLVDVTHVV